MIRISSIANLTAQQISDDELIMVSSQFEVPRQNFDVAVKLAEELFASGVAGAKFEYGAGLIQEGNPIPATLFEQLQPLPTVLLRPPRESDLFLLTPETARTLNRQSIGLYQLNGELLRRAASGALLYSCVESTPCLASNLPEHGPDVPLADADMIESLLYQSFTTEDVQLSEMDRDCVRSGILLLWNLLDDSHSISQTMEGRGSPRTGDYWHGIMHRREPDPGNAAYWFRRVGSHPAYESLMKHLGEWLDAQKTPDVEMQILEAELLKGRRWDPLRMVELCKQALRQPGSSLDLALRRVQYLEILNLLAFSFRDGPRAS